MILYGLYDVWRCSDECLRCVFLAGSTNFWLKHLPNTWSVAADWLATEMLDKTDQILRLEEFHHFVLEICQSYLAYGVGPV